MEMFLLVMGIDTVQKKVQEQFEAQEILPSLSGAYIPSRHEGERKHEDIRAWPVTQQAAPAPGHERHVA